MEVGVGKDSIESPSYGLEMLQRRLGDGYSKSIQGLGWRGEKGSGLLEYLLGKYFALFKSIVAPSKVWMI